MCLVKFRFVLYMFIIALLSKGRKFFKRGLRSAGLNYWYFRKEKQMLKTKSIALNINTIVGNEQKHKINLRSLFTNTKHESHKRSVYFYFLVMAQYFVVLLIFFISGESLGITTSPQQQNIQQTKDLCEVRGNCLASFR